MWTKVREPCGAAKGVEDAEVSRAVWTKVRAPSGAAGPGRPNNPQAGRFSGIRVAGTGIGIGHRSGNSAIFALTKRRLNRAYDT